MNKDMDWKFTEEIGVWVIDRKKMITLLIIREMPKKSKTKGVPVIWMGKNLHTYRDESCRPLFRALLESMGIVATLVRPRKQIW